jgi:hypothetical protein
MKLLLSGILLILILFCFDCCQNASPANPKTDSAQADAYRHALTGKLYLFAPEFDSTNLVATGACDCCSSNIAFLDDSIFLNIDYCEDGCTYVKGKYRYDNQQLVLNYDSVTIEKIYPEPDSTEQAPTDFVYNTTMYKQNSRTYAKNEYKGRIIFSNGRGFGAVDTGGTTIDMMNSVRAQGIWDKLNADPKSIVRKAEEEVNENLKGSWSLAGEKNASFQILEKTIYFLDQPKQYKYKIQNDSLKITYDNHESAFLVSMKGSDTLIFEGDDRQVYYRSKN